MPAGNGTYIFDNARRYMTLLKEKLEKAWPPKNEQPYRARIDDCRAIRSSDASKLRPTGWGEGFDGRSRDYIIDPLGERIPYVWADLLFGEDPVISPVGKTDRDRMDEMVNANMLPSELHRAEWICSSEGEVWYRIHPDDMMGHASIEFHSRYTVVPQWAGKVPGAVAFVSEIAWDGKAVYRYVEIHGAGLMWRLLYKGTEDGTKLGQQVSLSDRPETKDWEPEYQHKGDILAGRILNKIGVDRKFGVSDYSGLGDLLLALNEITTIGQENARLTAKQRAIIPQRFLNMFGNLPRSAEILIATDVDQDPDKIKNDVAMIEFEFDATALIAYTEHITDRVLTRARVAPQLVGRHTEGAQTGPALRARLVDSELAAQGKGKFWDDEGPVFLQKMIAVERDYHSIAWTQPKGKKAQEKLPSFKRSNAIPEDPEARSRRLAVSVNADFLSRRTAIAQDHPEWDDDRVQEEMDQIEKESLMGQAMVPDRSRGGNSIDKSNLPPGGTPADTQQAPSPATGGSRSERANGGVSAR